MRHIAFIINSGFKNKFGNLYFLRFIFNNFKNKIFMGHKQFLNNVWGEKWVFIQIKTILKLLKQLNNVKSRSTKPAYVRYLAFGVASLSFFFVLQFKFLGFVVQKSSLKLKPAEVFFVNLRSRIINRTLTCSELEQVNMLKELFKIT